MTGNTLPSTLGSRSDCCISMFVNGLLMSMPQVVVIWGKTPCSLKHCFSQAWHSRLSFHQSRYCNSEQLPSKKDQTDQLDWVLACYNSQKFLLENDIFFTYPQLWVGTLQPQ